MCIDADEKLKRDQRICFLMKKTKILVTVLLFVSATTAFPFGSAQGRAAVISLDGSITPSSPGFGSSGFTPEKVRGLIDRAENQRADAIIFEINSGGGAVVASKEIQRAIEHVEKPTVCRIRDVGASGGYLISLGCDHIIADSSSITGSIGVRASYLEFSGLLDKLGVEYVNVTAGNLKEAGSPYKNISSEERKVLESMVDQVHEDFLELVRNERNLTDSGMDKVRSARIFLGGQAEEIGLIDSLGGRRTAVKKAEQLVGKELNIFPVESSTGFDFLSLLTSNFKSSTSVLKAEFP